jgi:hypothetical protein
LISILFFHYDDHISVLPSMSPTAKHPWIVSSTAIHAGKKACKMTFRVHEALKEVSNTLNSPAASRTEMYTRSSLNKNTLCVGEQEAKRSSCAPILSAAKKETVMSERIN